MNPLVKITVSLLVATKEDEGAFLARCPFLNMVTQGASEHQALENLKEEIEFLFSSCSADHLLDRVLDERTSQTREPYSPDDFIKFENTYVDIPSGIPPEILKRIADAAVSLH